MTWRWRRGKREMILHTALGDIVRLRCTGLTGIQSRYPWHAPDAALVAQHVWH